LPNVGPYIYDVSISGFTRSAIYIYDISSLRVNIKDTFMKAIKYVLYLTQMLCFFIKGKFIINRNRNRNRDSSVEF